MARRQEMTVRYEDNTKAPAIYMALDLGRRRWTVGFLLPGDRDARLFQIAGGDRGALMAVGLPARSRSCASAKAGRRRPRHEVRLRWSGIPCPRRFTGVTRRARDDVEPPASTDSRLTPFHPTGGRPIFRASGNRLWR